MSSFDTARLLYLVILGVGIGGFFFVQGRASMGKNLQMALIWVFLFTGVAAAYQLWTDLGRSAARGNMSQFGDGQIAVPVQPDGHYYLTLDINRTPVRFVVDTGASDMVLTARDAEASGIDLSSLVYSGRAKTANGTVRIAPVQLYSVRLGDVTDTDVWAVVNEGEMEKSLLGMDYLRRWGRIEIAQGELILRR